MRRLLVLSTVLVLALSAGAGFASADTGGGGCFGPGQCRMSGLGADASWTTVPTDGPVTGVVYTDTFISTSASMTRGQGLTSSSVGVWFDEFSYSFDTAFNFIPVGETFVIDSGSNVTLSIDKKLSRATVAGTVMAVNCTFDAQQAETCGDPVATTVSGTWTATGARLKVSSTYHAKGPGLTQNQTFQGAESEATASATIGGASVAGPIQWADINDSVTNSVWICHTAGC